ncbi:hypothetical protein [Chryseobacterium candidae]|uniref:Uncharacterized protein n=1 Tax=Chryseobacterium candidae TaxID=1978493 RepID=A0ABY2R661_9FLAO|nr:hypothetical protein [Chryseobacterium candidae]THV58933.1 hypothetical protein EK417_11215 [Chryseobacterium candidae]
MKKINYLIITLLSVTVYSQVGINTSNPQTVFHIDGKKDNHPTNIPSTTEEKNDVVVTENGHVGIGIISPSQNLDVNGNVRFRTVPESNSVVTTDKIMVLQEDGTAKKVDVKSLQPAEKFALDDIYSVTATSPVLRNIEGTWTTEQKINNIDIGMSQLIVIPPNTSTMIAVNYSVPLGMDGNSQCANNVLNYYGIRFLKNGVERPAGSRKFSFPNLSTSAQVSTVTASYTEQIVNNSTNSLNITYSLNGYLEFKSGTITSSPCTVKYNMASASGENYNWGKSNMSVQTFKKPL